ncbi:MAG: alpha/beta fold hydrolase, partial [Nannocystaceae bacterium]
MVSGIKRSRLRVRRLGKQLRRAAFGARNAVKVVRGGRFVPPYEASYELAANIGFVRLRHYPQDPPELPLTCAQPILLVPPLMVTSQVYDIAPDLSAIAFLRRAGFDVWLVDFGAPEDERGGLDRTLDQHVLAIDAAIDLIRERTGEPVHLAGYSQGGMFAYQVAAYRKGEGVASVITFGAPVDMQKNLGADVNRDLLANLARGAWTALARPFDAVSGIPGTFSSFGFKMLNPVKELQYLRMMLGALDDREALARLEPTRRFLGGEGFVAWPGPAFRSFVDDVIVHNRMMSGGFVINGRTVTLADIRAPILCFVGVRDEFARPRSVRAIAHAAPSAELHERAIDAGHFGLVVGSRAMDEVWPTVTRWILWSAGAGPRPTELVDVRARAGEPT